MPKTTEIFKNYLMYFNQISNKISLSTLSKRLFFVSRQFCSKDVNNNNISTDNKQNNDNERDELFKSIELEVRGHDKAVLNSYTSFVKNVCVHLNIENSPVTKFPYVRWIQYALRAKFAKKKYKLHYETRTHIRSLSVYNLTGSTASTFLEYIERNIPEGVAMKVTYEELCFLPKTINL